MGQIYQKDFSAGLCPGDDYLNGRENACLTLDNLNMDELGSLTLVRSNHGVNGTAFAPLNVVACYSKIVNSSLSQYVQLDSGGVVLRDHNNAGTFITTILPAYGGDVVYPATFGNGFGQVFIASPAGAKEDDGVTLNNWGLPAQTTDEPTIGLQVAVAAPFYGSAWNPGDFVAIVGTDANIHNTVQVATAGGQSLVRRTSPLDLNTFVNSGESGDPADVFYMAHYSLDDASLANLNNIIVRAITTPGVDYFEYVFSAALYPRSSNLRRWAILTLPRGNFGSVGAPNWASIAEVEVEMNMTTGEGQFAFAQPFEFYNDNVTLANLNAYSPNIAIGNVYPYIYFQQDVWNSGQFQGRSPFGTPSRPIWGKWASAQIYTVNNGSTDPRVNFADVYKNGGTLGGQYYFVDEVAIGGVVNDGKPDSAYLILATSGEPNAIGNVFLNTIHSGTGNDQIVGICGPINGRMVMITPQNILITDYLNPEAFDSRLTLTPSGSGTESLLWCEKISNSIVLVASNQDIYEVSGTFTPIAVGSNVFDISIRAMGIKQPPISPSRAVLDNAILYIAADGVRSVNFNTLATISPELMLLWRQENRYGVPGFDVQAFGVSTFLAKNSFNIGIAKQKIYVRVQHTDSTFSVFVFDRIRNAWYRRLDSAICFALKENGVLLAGTSNGYLVEYEINNPTTATFVLQTIAHDGGTPRQRKDLFTLKLMIATDNQPVTVILQNEVGTQTVITTTLAVPGTMTQEVFLPVAGISIDLFKRYSIVISGTSDYVNIGEWSLEFNERPSPQLYVILLPTNFGVNSKKRVRTLPMVIDTRGENVTYTPMVDGVVLGPPTVFNTSQKTTVFHQFVSDTFGVDYGGTLQANTGIPFEFYGFLESSSVEELPVPRLFDQAGPYPLDRRGKLLSFRTRLLATGTSLAYNVFADDVSVYSGTIVTTPNVDTTYEIMKIPMTVIANVLRVEFSSSSAFYRWYTQFRVSLSGMETDNKWITAAGKVTPNA